MTIVLINVFKEKKDLVQGVMAWARGWHWHRTAWTTMQNHIWPNSPFGEKRADGSARENNQAAQATANQCSRTSQVFQEVFEISKGRKKKKNPVGIVSSL